MIYPLQTQTKLVFPKSFFMHAFELLESCHKMQKTAKANMWNFIFVTEKIEAEKIYQEHEVNKISCANSNYLILKWPSFLVDLVLFLFQNCQMSFKNSPLIIGNQIHPSSGQSQLNPLLFPHFRSASHISWDCFIH